MPPADKTRVKRRYDASSRRSAAERTSLRVIDAAQTLFIESGYAQTSVSAIAARARVSVDTVYASVGRKPQILLAVHDRVLAEGPEPVPAEQRAYVQAVRAASTAREKLTRYAEALARVLPGTVPLMTALRDAGQADAECRRTWQAINDRRAANMLTLARELRATGDVRDDLDDQWVADLLWTTNSAEFFTLLTARGHTPEAYASIVLDLWCRTLLRHGQPPADS